MKVLFVWPVTRMSVWDVARGHRNALSSFIGEANIRDYYLDKHTSYHRRALPEEVRDNVQILSRYASETVLNEALYFGADLVWVISGLNFHPIGLWLLDKVNIPAAALLTESPYEDENQADWASPYPRMLIMTNDLVSHRDRGWFYVPHSFDPAIHRPTPPSTRCDVLMVGTGWPERQKFLESIDWTGIDLKLFGVWPDLTRDSPLWRYHISAIIDNERISQLYCGAKICLNHHRTSLTAQSLGPRAYEIAGCGAFQMCDYRPELFSEFGDSIPVYRDAAELEGMIRYYLQHDHERTRLARSAHHRALSSYTFKHRMERILDRLTSYISGFRSAPINTLQETA